MLDLVAKVGETGACRRRGCGGLCAWRTLGGGIHGAQLPLAEAAVDGYRRIHADPSYPHARSTTGHTDSCDDAADDRQGVCDHGLTRLPDRDVDARAQGHPLPPGRLPTGLHPLLVRAAGSRGTARPSAPWTAPPLAGWRCSTASAPCRPCASDAERIQTNHEIARFLERLQPEPALFPAEPERRQAVEHAERWGDEVLQMAARRVALRDPDEHMTSAGADGSLGPLLARSGAMRALAVAHDRAALSRRPAQPATQLLAAIPPMLDTVDAWIGEGRALCRGAERGGLRDRPEPRAAVRITHELRGRYLGGPPAFS